ncbi:MAG: hypothetical protein AAB699_01470 [Patescibacteria group bacterium]|mgnify:CR=1 FL=1
MQPTNNSASAKVISALILGLIVGFVAGAFWQERRQGAVRPSEETAAVGAVEAKQEAKMEGKKEERLASAGDAALASSTAAVLATNQSAGSAVIVSQVVSAEPVWVAVREERNGGVGNILGARKVAAGTSGNVVVELLRPTKAGARYLVVLHEDAGDPAFNYREDVLIPGVQATFVAE